MNRQGGPMSHTPRVAVAIFSLLFLPMVLALALVTVLLDGRSVVAQEEMDGEVWALVDSAPLIVRGQVATSQGRWNQDHTALVTDNQIQVHYPVAGEAPSPLWVQTPGGTLPEEDVALLVAHAARLAVGQEVLLLLAPQGDGWTVVGGDEGVFTVVNGHAISGHGQAYPLDALLQAIVDRLHRRGRPVSLPADWPEREARVPPSPVQAADFVYRELRWEGPSPKVYFRVNINTDQVNGDNGTAEDFLRAILAAADVWNQVETADFLLVYDGPTDSTAIGYNQANEILFMRQGTDGAAGMAQVWYSSSTGYIREADIWLNDDLRWDAVGSPAYNELDLQSVVIHEMGHWLALGHDSEPDSVMYASITMGPASIRRTLHPNDRAGISFIYPCNDVPCGPAAPTPTPTPSSTPTPAPTVPTPTPTPTARVTLTPTLTVEPTTPTPTPTSGSPTQVLVNPDAHVKLQVNQPGPVSVDVEVPSGAVDRPTLLRYAPISLVDASARAGLQYANHAFSLEAEQEGEVVVGLRFFKPITVTLHYSDQAVANLDETSLYLYYRLRPEDEWTDVAADPAAYHRNPDENRLAVTTDHAAQFALFSLTGASDGPGLQYVFLPLVER